MSGYTVNTGSTAKFSEGWDRVFGAGSTKKSKKQDGPRLSAKSTASKKSAAKKKHSKAT